MKNAVRNEIIDGDSEIYDLIGFHQNAEGAYPIGTIIEKVNSEEGDNTINGTIGIIQGSKALTPEQIAKAFKETGILCKYLYCVQFPQMQVEGHPEIEVFQEQISLSVDAKIREHPEVQNLFTKPIKD